MTGQSSARPPPPLDAGPAGGGARRPPDPRMDRTQRRGRGHRPRRSHSGARVVRLAHLPRGGAGRRGQGDRAAPDRPPDGADWLACVGGQVVGRAAVPLQAVRAAEAALGGD